MVEVPLKYPDLDYFFPNITWLFLVHSCFSPQEKMFQPFLLRASPLIYSFVNGLVVMGIFHLCVGPAICRIWVAL